MNTVITSLSGQRCTSLQNPGDRYCQGNHGVGYRGGLTILREFIRSQTLPHRLNQSFASKPSPDGRCRLTGDHAKRQVPFARVRCCSGVRRMLYLEFTDNMRYDTLEACTAMRSASSVAYRGKSCTTI